jgi:hypothetical protein
MAQNEIGTVSVAFTPTMELDDPSTSSSTTLQHYQSITLQSQYKPYSLEELRVTEYNNALKGAHYESVAQGLRTPTVATKKQETVISGPSISWPATGQLRLQL